MFNIGPHTIYGRAVLAPMAGITDLPFRNLCRAHGAALAVSEMITAQTHLWNSRKSQTRLSIGYSAQATHSGLQENGLRSVQIAGSEPQQLADAARACADAGADIVDINMGCPAKKVCSKAAGSALLRDEILVGQILEAVCTNVDVPVTLKIRTGWDEISKNALTIARIAQSSGIKALAVHGRTRACRFTGTAEFTTIGEVAASIDIPVIANGDITSADSAKKVLAQTGAAAVMIGRGAQGNPWLFEQINAALAGNCANYKNDDEHTNNHKYLTPLHHLGEIHTFYGDSHGVRIARKHFGWYADQLLRTPAQARNAKQAFNSLLLPQEQLQLAKQVLSERLPLEEEAA